jgi:hypothetical protein
MFFNQYILTILEKRATLAVQKRSQASTLQAAVATERKDTMM